MNNWSYALAKQLLSLAKANELRIPTDYGEIVLDNPKDISRVVQVLQRIAGKREVEQRDGNQ